jgi:hypothetical protein
MSDKKKEKKDAEQIDLKPYVPPHNQSDDFDVHVSGPTAQPQTQSQGKGASGTNGTKQEQGNYSVSSGQQDSTLKTSDIQKQPEKKSEQK